MPPVERERGLAHTTLLSLILLRVIAAVYLLPIGLAFEIVASAPIRRQFASQQWWRATSRASLTSLGATDRNKHGKADSIGTVAILVPSAGGDLTVSKFASHPSTETPLSFRDGAEKVSVKVHEMSSDLIVVSVCSVPESISPSPEDFDSVRKIAVEADVLIGLGLTSPFDVRYLSRLFRERRLADLADEEPSWQRAGKRCQFALGCDKPFAPIVGPHDEANPSLLAKLPWTGEASGRQTMYQMMGLFERWTVDNFAEAIILFFSRFSDRPIPTNFGSTEAKR